MKLILGDSLQKLKDLPTNTIDAVVTDPPYGISFMQRTWDYDVPSEDLWREVFRVMKPGAHLLSFFGTRTYHAGVTRIEAAGFEVRDMLSWLYGSGFPKSLDVSKAIDKAAGAEREVIGQSPNWRPAKTHGGAGFDAAVGQGPAHMPLTAPATADAKAWQGYGTALKPANEPIVLARKPLEKGLTVAQNVLRWGTGALSIDACRISMTDEDRAAVQAKANKKDTTNNIIAGFGNNTATHGDWSMSKGRWPANVIFGCACDGDTHAPDCAVALLDAQSGVSKSSVQAKVNRKNGVLKHGGTNARPSHNTSTRTTEIEGYSDSGGASRFFYVAKASKRERGPGNGHPTVKPIKLMEYLIKLVCPPGGVVLDPFLGSGTTLVAAKRLGVLGIGIEREEAYLAIARKRIEEAHTPEPALDDGQLPLPEVPA